jgi:integrase
VNSEATVKTWEKTKLQNLVRHKSGRYYVRLFRNGKEIWKSLKTSHFSVAEAKLAEELKAHREMKTKAVDSGDAKIKFSAAAAIHMQRLEARATIKKRTREYWKEILKAVVKSWPGLPETEVRKITPAMCRDWAARHVHTTSGNCYNNAISLLRHILGVAKELGVIYSNPADEVERITVRGKQLKLPTLAKFAEFIAEMRRAHSRDSKNCADLTEGLAYTGMRKGEASQVTRGDVNFTTGEIRVLGDPEDGTKNGEVRYVPLIPQARALFVRMLAERPDEDDTAKLFKVRECQKSITRAAEKVEMARITHHDLRHFFATVCIESGVDIPTVSRWLGHKDGGALAMKTYGHLRREHSVAQAQKVSFVPLAA